MEVVLPVAPPTPPVDFNFDSNCSSPYITAPSSPQRFANNFFFSAPTSPSRVSPLFSESSLPFHQETKPNNHNNNYSFGNDDDFEFDFSGNLQRESLSAADELFDGGKIRPMKPPPRFHSGDIPNSPRTRKKKTVHNPERDSNPFEAAIEETLRKEEEKRGRERVTSSGRKGSRSLSPLKVSDIIENLEDKDVSVSSSTSNNVKSFLSFTKGYRKWKIRDLFLFRSASEGRANEKDPLRKYTALSKKSVAEDDVRNSSFRSTESSGSFSRGRGPVSAHEIHYTINRAATEEMKKRTFLPYKRGLLGCLGSTHRMDQISRGIGSFSRS